MQKLAEFICRHFGHSRDWPEMETCSRCGVHMPLDDILRCGDCGLPYADHGSDLTLPREQWEMINGGEVGGVLCGRCICRRAHRLGAIAVRARIEFAGDPPQGSEL